MSACTVAAFPASVRGNPYCDLLYGSLTRTGVRVVTDAQFSVGWLVRHRRRVDILHVHWPEFYYRRAGGRVTARSVATFVAGVLVARLLGYRLVWTVHNALPHERHWIDRALRGLLMRTARVVLHAEAARLALPRTTRPSAVIPHGNYIGAYPDTCAESTARAQLGLPDDARVFLCFGQLRAYKGVLDLLGAFTALPDPRLRLVIAGRVASDADADAIRTAAMVDARIRPYLRYIEDAYLQLFFKAADWVVLPYREVLTSGAVMLALSFGRPVIVPRRGCLMEIGERGCGITYDPADARTLHAALAEATAADPRPLRARALAAAQACDWGRIAQAYVRLFEGV